MLYKVWFVCFQIIGISAATEGRSLYVSLLYNQFSDSFGEDFDKRVMEWKEVAEKKMMMIEVKLRIF